MSIGRPKDTKRPRKQSTSILWTTHPDEQSCLCARGFAPLLFFVGQDCLPFCPRSLTPPRRNILCIQNQPLAHGVPSGPGSACAFYRAATVRERLRPSKHLTNLFLRGALVGRTPSSAAGPLAGLLSYGRC